MLKAFGFHGLELAAYAFEIQAYQKGYVCIEAVKRDKSGHFFKDDGAPCPHRKSGGQSRQSGGRKAKYGKLAEKLVRAPDAMKRINNPTGETITASDGKPAIFNEKSVKHVVGDHTKAIGKTRMKELGIAQDTTATGLSFESVNKGKPQTEFIKKYIIGDKEVFYYTSRRGNSSVVYSWHELTVSNYQRKLGEWKKYREGKK